MQFHSPLPRSNRFFSLRVFLTGKALRLTKRCTFQKLFGTNNFCVSKCSSKNMPIRRKLNKNFFNDWNPSMAYVLGYFAADGYMVRNKRGACFIEFVSIDKWLIENIRSAMQSNHKVSVRTFPIGSNLMTKYRLQIGSKDIHASLSRIGFTTAKSNIVEFPAIPEEYLPHFVRGYFDGDGHVSISHYQRKGRIGKSVTLISGFTCGSKTFLSVLHTQLKKYAKIVGGSLHRTNCYHLTFSIRDSIKLHDFLYADAGVEYLQRKKIVFEKFARYMDP